MISEHICVGEVQKDFDKVSDVLDEYLALLKIKGEDASRFRLLAEEALALVRTIADKEDPVEVWFEGNARVSNIILAIDSRMNPNKREQFISVASSGENAIKQGFFDHLKYVFLKHEEPTWSLAQYEAELLMKRNEDKYAQESWDDLERSVLANLADNISVQVDEDHVLMVITKDFSVSMYGISQSKPLITTSQIYVTSDPKRLEVAQNAISSYVDELLLEKRDSMHMKLLFEETIGMMKEMTGEFYALLWAEKYKDKCCLRLVAKTNLNSSKKKGLLSISTHGENAAATGFMGKLMDAIETMSLEYEDATKMDQDGAAILGIAELGIYSDANISRNSAGNSGMMWSMVDYKEGIENVDEVEFKTKAWDELEKSIVASVAEDIIVGVNRNETNITMIYKLEGK